MEIMRKIAAKAQDLYGRPVPAIAFLGDSVTQGCFEIFLQEGNCQTVFEQEHAYSTYVSEILRTLFPNVPVCIINAGISGDSAANGADRLERDVLRFRPDLTVVCFGLNDCVRGPEYAEEYGQSLRCIFRKLLESGSEVIYMTPNMMNTCVDRDHIKEPILIDMAEYCMKMQTEGVVDAYLEQGKQAAEEYGVPVCDVYEKWKTLNRCGADITGLLANRINHPSRKMNWLFAWSLVETMLLESGSFPMPDEKKTAPEQLEELLTYAKGAKPHFEPLPQYDRDTAYGKIKAGFLSVFGKGNSRLPQKLFCYMGIPEQASKERKVPGMLLIHGGAGQAYAEWVEEWMRRGYGAVTVDLYGNMPLENGDYVYNFMDPEEKHAYRSTPTGMCNGGFDLAHPGERITDQGMFHVIAANILAGNLLRSMPAVDEERVGVTGISWGGVSASILIGFDQRFAFAVPVYGSAFLEQCRTYFHDWYQDAGCAALWEAGRRLHQFCQPILWINDVNDDAFSANSTTLSFLYSVDGTLCLKYDLPHTHKFDIEEVYAFAEQVLHDGTPLPVFEEAAAKELGRMFSLKTNLPEQSDAGARLYYITQPMSYRREGDVTRMEQSWLYAPDGAVVEGSDVKVRVPQEACAYFIELWRGNVMTSSPLVEFVRTAESMKQS